ncbi:hypothetical protein HBE99_14895 [Mycobacteroides chelonae]|uniref:hypothetical protein n=1 Tax=Mycobacteroides chelonae TaxID=1774 RepID=UPI0019100572|nr:hypothetical protein [Mycobacteroides chelonae]QQG97967.1 hypothetical protein HBE99_14895 [Mycobacteroides chelonae]
MTTVKTGKGDRRLSLSQAVVLLIVALIAFFGGLKTNEISTRNNQATITAAKEENLKQFRRGQEQYDRYAAVLKDATALRNRGGFTLASIGNPTDPNHFTYTIVIRPGNAMIHSAPPAPGTPPQPAPPGPTTIEDVHGPWQEAYTTLAQAVSEVEIAASDTVILAARALRDKYRDEYRQSILSQIDNVRVRLNQKFDYENNGDFADALVAVPANPSPAINQAELMKKTIDQLTQEYVNAVKADLGL